MCERVPVGTFTLNGIVANCIRSTYRLVEIPRFQSPVGLGLTGPCPSETIRLQLDPHRLAVTAATAVHDAHQVLDVVPILVRDHICHGEITTEAELLLEPAVEPEIEVDPVITRTVEGSGIRSACATAACLRGTIEDNKTRLGEFDGHGVGLARPVLAQQSHHLAGELLLPLKAVTSDRLTLDGYAITAFELPQDLSDVDVSAIAESAEQQEQQQSAYAKAPAYRSGATPDAGTAFDPAGIDIIEPHEMSS